tara:strand:+ start:4735 stop:5163 length:429 start_codon:yes stop_codon:yes gene_type:complete
MSQDDEIYNRERDKSLEAEQKQAEQCDKLLIMLSSGAFVLSMTFIKDITPQIVPASKSFLVTAWCFFLLSLFTTIISFFLSQVGLRLYRDKVIQRFPEFRVDAENYQKLLSNMKQVWICNLASFVFLIIGSVFLVIFAYRNL